MMALIKKLKRPKELLLSLLCWTLLSVEMFGVANLHIFALVCVACFVLSGRSGLYASQQLPLPKLEGKQ